jgi:hypothetical protein
VNEIQDRRIAICGGLSSLSSCLGGACSRPLRYTFAGSWAVTMHDDAKTSNLISWIFGTAVFAIGVVNTFWGNDPGLGIALLLLSFVYFPPANALLEDWAGFSIHSILKIILGILILWISLGVGELFDKVDLMMMDLFPRQ